MDASAVIPFDFSTLDGLAFAAIRNRLPELQGRIYKAAGLGPLFELARLSLTGVLPAPTQAAWLELGHVDEISQAMRLRQTYWFCRETKIGYLRTKSVFPENEHDNNAFMLEAQKAATSTGFSRKIASSLIGAFEELIGNIYDHSMRPETGIAAYRAVEGSFEFVVSDCGLGILDSLRMSKEFADLADHGRALELALQDGVTRYGRGNSHGKGFRPIFVGLANTNGSMRFRTGDQALTIDGTIRGDIPTQTWEKIFMPGFTASIICKV